MKRKMTALMLTLVMILSLCACTASAENTKITFWHSMSDNAGVLMESYIQQFNATVGKEKGIEVELVFQGSYADATTKMNSMLNTNQTDTLPDVMQLDATGKVSYHASGVAYTIDQARADDAAFDTGVGALLSAAMGNWNFSGTQLGLPFATSTTILFYNKTLLDSVNMQAPETFADIIALAAALPKTTEAGTELTPYAAIPNTPTLANWLGQLDSYVVNHKNGSEASATELACIENGALATFLTEWKRMYDEGALKNTAASSDAFVTGQLALYTSSSSNVTSLLNKINGGFEMGVAFYPKVNEEASFGASVSGSCLVMFDKQDDAKKAAARELLLYLTSAPIQADFAVGTGYIPANENAVNEAVYQQLLQEYPQYKVGMEQLAVTPAAMRSVTVGPSTDFYYAIQNCVSDMLEYGDDVETTVDIMADELGGLLYQYAQANQ